MAGPPALDEEELSSGDENSEEEGDDYETGGDEGEVNVGLGGLDMSDTREKRGEEENHLVNRRGNGGKRSGEEYFDGGYGYYVKPWNRAQPYLIGIVLGYILHK